MVHSSSGKISISPVNIRFELMFTGGGASGSSQVVVHKKVRIARR